MKVAFAVAFALALFASTGSALAQSDERSTTQTDSFAYGGGGTEEREAAGRPCSDDEWSAAGSHCYWNHTNYFAVCNLTSCVVRNGWIVYTWSGYTLGIFADGEVSPAQIQCIAA